MSIDKPLTGDKTKKNIKISTGKKVEREPLHKRIDKEKYSKDVEKFYTDTYDVKPNGQTKQVEEKTELGEKIQKLQDEMSRQKQHHREQEEVKRQKIPAELVEKPKTNAQRMDQFIS